MSKDKKLASSGETEYQYADESLGQEALQEPSRKKSLLRMLQEKIAQRLPKSRKFRILFFLTITAYIVYNFLNIGGGAKEVPYNSRPIDTHEMPINLKPANVAHPETLTTSTSQPQQLLSSSLTPAATSSSLLGADTSLVYSSEMPKVNEMEAKINQLNQAISGLQSALLSLTGSAVRLSEKVTRLEKMNQAQKKQNDINPLPVFYLQSLVSGRAWIYAAIGGNTMSVKLGDTIPGYGQVKKIDFHKGIIWTTSDRQIQYGNNDN